MRVLVAMSGGVDSTVAAKMLMDAGFEVGGAYMHMLPPELRSERDGRDAADAAVKLGIPFYTFDVVSEFCSDVLQYFCDAYIAGRTPNPCVICNQKLKFGAFYEKAAQLGYEKIATGHYARVEERDGEVLLLRSENRKKDQSYFLHGLRKAQLERAVFPLENSEKGQVREIAASFGFLNAEKKDSQDICFVKNGAYAEFIEAYTGRRLECGNFTDRSGAVIGTHAGIARYTIGQRKGVRTAFGRPLYVVSKNAADQTVVMGENDALFSTEVHVRNFNLLYAGFDAGNLTAKHRYGQEDAAVSLELAGADAVLRFEKPQRAVTPGQFAVVYDGEIVVGGGEIA